MGPPSTSPADAAAESRPEHVHVHTREDERQSGQQRHYATDDAQHHEKQRRREAPNAQVALQASARCGARAAKEPSSHNSCAPRRQVLSATMCERGPRH